MEPWQSWTVVAVIASGGYWYYFHNASTPSTSQPQRRASELSEESTKRRKKGKGTHAQDEMVAANGNEKSKKRKGNMKEKTRPEENPAEKGRNSATLEKASEDPGDDRMDDKEFAKTLANLRNGTTLSKPDGAGGKSKKANKRNGSLLSPPNGKPVEPATSNGLHEMSTTSSTTGADADDDLSPAASPALGATSTTKKSGDITDMLEVPAKGPSILRLTQSSQPQVERQPKVQKAVQEPETKKQRQRKRKNEEAKAVREQDEKERRTMMEKQRRTAREAEGRPAKNGLGPSSAAVPSVWNKSSDGQTAFTDKTPITNGDSQLLDTLEAVSRPVKADSKTEMNGTASTATQKAWDGDVPSEEDQVRMISEIEDDGWNTVQKGGKTKKKPTVPISESASEKGDAKVDWSVSDEVSNSSNFGNGKTTVAKPDTRSVINGNSTLKSKATKDQIDPKVWNRSNIHNHPDYDPEFPYALTGHPDDSDWAVV